MSAALLSMLLTALPGEMGCDTLVLCPAEMQPALRPWVEHRIAQGHRINLGVPPRTPAAVRQLVRDQAAKSGRLRWLVLIGDAGTGPGQLPVELVPAKVNIHWGSEPQIATDNTYADLDDDGVPDLAVGRLTADSSQELSGMVAKILRYERQSTFGPWRRQINFVAGVGGFGFIDSVIEMVTKKFLTDGIPPEFHTTMTYGSWQSSFCPCPSTFHHTALERLNEGCLFWVYIGHGQRQGLDRVRVPGARYHILGVDDAAKLQARSGPAVAVFLACYTGAFDAPQDCLAEEMLRADGGPVAVFSGSRVTMPYAMAVLGTGLMREYFVNKRATLGEIVLYTKRSLVQDGAGEQDAKDRLAANRKLLDMLAGAFSPRPELIPEERREHLSLFNLLGDPLLRMRQGSPIDLQVPQQLRAGQTVKVAGTCPTPGRLRLELVCRRDRQKAPAPKRRTFDPSNESLRAYDVVYQQANDRSWQSRLYAFDGGDFETELSVPWECRGACVVRVFVEGQDSFALGAQSVYVSPPQHDEAPLQNDPPPRPPDAKPPAAAGISG